ncbi:MAG TPA: SDR family NAD(P)-dependent oxidoreductase, partial [Opitutaceae bacterium]|nr:SDR family NAD(P)-dependent oxidoreductase [Opitutaceae bacterium]
MFALTGKSAVVTGGSSGIGRAIAHRLREAGARVLVADRRPTSGDFEFCETDVSSEDDVAAMFDTAQRLFGRVDI